MSWSLYKIFGSRKLKKMKRRGKNILTSKKMKTNKNIIITNHIYYANFMIF